MFRFPGLFSDDEPDAALRWAGPSQQVTVLVLIATNPVLLVLSEARRQKLLAIIIFWLPVDLI